MKKPISLWIILAVFILVTIVQIIFLFSSISTLVGIFISNSADLNLITSVSIIWSIIQTFSLPILYVITLYVIFMSKKIALPMLKIFWSVSMLPIITVVINSINNSFSYNQAESSGEILGILLFAGLCFYLTYCLFFSTKIKLYFQSVKE